MKNGKDYIGVGVGAVIINSKGEFFLSKRGEKVRNESGKWEFPGGGVDFGEKAVEAIVREMKEEYDIEIEVIDFLDFHDHIIEEEGQHWVAPTYLAKLKSGEAKIMEKHKCEEIGWFKISEIEEKELSLISKLNLESLKKIIAMSKAMGEMGNN